MLASGGGGERWVPKTYEFIKPGTDSQYFQGIVFGGCGRSFRGSSWDYFFLEQLLTYRVENMISGFAVLQFYLFSSDARRMLAHVRDTGTPRPPLCRVVHPVYLLESIDLAFGSLFEQQITADHGLVWLGLACPLYKESPGAGSGLAWPSPGKPGLDWRVLSL